MISVMKIIRLTKLYNKMFRKNKVVFQLAANMLHI